MMLMMMVVAAIAVRCIRVSRFDRVVHGEKRYRCSGDIEG